MMAAWQRLRAHWPEYLIEAGGLASILFVSAAITANAETALRPGWPAGSRSRRPIPISSRAPRAISPVPEGRPSLLSRRSFRSSAQPRTPPIIAIGQERQQMAGGVFGMLPGEEVENSR